MMLKFGFSCFFYKNYAELVCSFAVQFCPKFFTLHQLPVSRRNSPIKFFTFLQCTEIGSFTQSLQFTCFSLLPSLSVLKLLFRYLFHLLFEMVINVCATNCWFELSYLVEKKN